MNFINRWTCFVDLFIAALCGLQNVFLCYKLVFCQPGRLVDSERFSLNLQKGPLDATYDDFLVDLKAKDGDEDDCRYAIYDYHYFVNTQGTSEPSAR